MANPKCAPTRTPFVGSGRRPEGGFLAVHKRDFNAHISGGGFRHCASQIDVEDGISIPGDTVQEVLENLNAGTSDWFETLTAGNFSGGVDVDINGGSEVINSTVGSSTIFKLSDNASGSSGSWSFNGGHGSTIGSGFFINAGDGDSNGGGNIGINGGDSVGGNGGDISLSAGEGILSGGSISLSSGKSDASGGFLSLNSGSTLNGAAGDIYINSGNVLSGGSGTPGNIYVTSYNNLFFQSYEGILQLNNGAPLNWPTADGTAGQAMITNGAGQLSFTTISGGGGGEDLGETLSIGANTDNITIESSGSNIAIQKASGHDLIFEGSPFADLILRIASINSFLKLGDISLIGASNSGSGDAGGVNILSGNSTYTSGGDINIETGVGDVGGSINIEAGSGNTTAGSIDISTGGSINGGDINIETNSSTNVGDINIKTNSGTSGGDINIETSPSTNAGNINIKAGLGTTTPGDILIQSGSGIVDKGTIELKIGEDLANRTVLKMNRFFFDFEIRNVTDQFSSTENNFIIGKNLYGIYMASYRTSINAIPYYQFYDFT